MWPALALEWSPFEGAEVEDQLALVLDGLPVTAVEERGAGSWHVYFEHHDEAERARNALLETLAGRLRSCERFDVADEGWVVRAQASLRPVRAGRFVIAPPWDVSPTPEAGPAFLVVIEPSMGFGTGHHQSTRLCLRALDRVSVPARVLDAGTGSGVLAIAAARLGATGVVAFDHDADAVAAARANVVRNGVEGVVDVRLAALGDPLPPARLVTANLTASVLVDRHAEIEALVDPRGTLVVGGVLADQVDAVLGAFSGWTARSRLDEDEWVGLILARRT